MKFAFIFCVVGFATGCSHFMSYKSRAPAEQSASACESDYALSTETFFKKVHEHPGVFTDVQALEKASENAKFICAGDSKLKYGFDIDVKSGRIYVDPQLTDIDSLFGSEVGKQGIEKYQINERDVYFQHLKVAIVAQSLYVLSGRSAADYDIFFKTLKLFQK